MKKSTLLLSFLGLFIVSQLDSQITMNSSGNVGIGSSPNTEKLKVNGNFQVFGAGIFNNFYTTVGYQNIKAHGEYYTVTLRPTSNNSCRLGNSSYYWDYAYINHLITNSSDISRKENIRPLEGSLDKILNIRGVLYDLKPEEIMSDSMRDIINDPEYIRKKTEENTNMIGFIAQEVKDVIPSIIHYDDSNDIYSVEYLQLIPILAEAIKEQQKLIDAISSELSLVKAESTLKAATSIESYAEFSEIPLLFQNAPNPFYDNTVINFYVPEGSMKTKIYIYNMTGKQLKSIPITQIGKSSITVTGSEFEAGIYIYSMVIDNEIIDTKQMILTD